MTKNPYYKHAVNQKENPNSNIASYATLVVEEYDKYYNNTITMEDFVTNTPNIDDGAWPEQINYIRNQLCIENS